MNISVCNVMIPNLFLYSLVIFIFGIIDCFIYTGQVEQIIKQ